MDDMLKPREVGVPYRWDTVFPTPVFPDLVPAPVRHVERRIGKNEVKPLVAQFIFVKTPFIVPPDVGINATHGKVHLGKTPCGVVRLLPVHRDVAKASAVLAHERFRLDKHAAGTAAGIV